MAWLEHELNRRNFLKIGGAFAGKTVIDAAFPHLAKAETLSEWNPITIKQDDTFWSICSFYGVADRQAEIAEVNQITNPSKIYTKRTLSLPLETNYLEMPFKKFILAENGQNRNVSLTNDCQAFKSYCQEMILYEGKKYPFVLNGHSSPDGNLVDVFIFHSLLRKLLYNRELELQFWLERLTGNSYIEGILKGNFVGHSSNHEEISLANSQKLILRTCATGTPSEKDALYCLAPIVNYNSAGPKD